MPRIRKKTSKRGTTNDRKKITQKVRETRKKNAKAAKKSVEWKSSETKEGPGIPNTFPYKDQILAEVAEQRRLAAEDKQRRKDAKKGLKSVDTQVSETNAEGDDDGFDGIASISAKRLTAKATGKPAPAPQASDSDEEDDAPILINRELQHLQAVLDQADAVVEILDARDPLSFHSSHLEEIIGSKAGKKALLVVNKIDCAPQESVTAWVSTLRKQQPTFPFRSASACLPVNPLIPKDVKGKGKAKHPADDALGADAILDCLGKWAEEKKGDSPFTVAVVGVTNTGKSSLINSLTKKNTLPVYSLTSSSRGPTTTTMPQEMITEVAGKPIRFIDTPGFTWEWDTDKTSPKADEIRARDILMRNKGRIDRLKDPLSPVSHLISRANPEDLMMLYSLPAFPKGDIDAFVSGVARSQQLVRKRGALDLAGASKTVLRDWCTGKIHWYSTPPSELTATAETSAPDTWLESLYAKGDAAVMGSLESRKDMRKAGGLVKISPGQVDGRKVLTEGLYADPEESSDEEEDEFDEMDVDEEAEDEELDAEDEDEQDEDEEEEEEERMSRSQKRKRVDQAPLPSKKKVSFAATKGRSSSKGGANSKASSRPKPTAVPPMQNATKTKEAKPVANAPSKSRPQKAASGKSDGEEYDFGKYF
ncbi:P-loop containing nucleoside triphosphate hydrolase protein [Gymnopus androsaceus JB14]|uniref:P-loop containing nucleoside triphosphate hydrolase protein n=1 Tax=Gymnopus androsaceus JB14 TaxID=1447944 RepID=A0A6A4GQU3_9AGAR|nr:P-loop containing nucleoside triphosphate hydrolase protein [Gymnopus androsaceus JB14]